MTFNKSYICAALMALALSACDNDPWSMNQGELKEGQLYLSVSKKEPAATRAAVDTKDFPVTITGKGDVAKVVREYASVGVLPEVITLPVGTYDVEAHTPGNLLKEMDAPYYLGKKEVEITNIPTNTEVKCPMANSKIQVNFDDAFMEKFVTWEVTINDGTEHVLTFNNWSARNLCYWWFDKPTKTIYVDIRAVTKSGEKVTGNATYQKSQSMEGYTDIENEYFTGGDAIVINFTPETDKNGYLTGITLTATITFENYNEDVTIEVVDNGDNDEPDPGTGGDDIILETNYPESGVVATYGQTSDFPSVQVNFTFPTGLKHLYVKVGGSPDFEFACGLMGLTSGEGLDLASDAALELQDLFVLPKAGDKTYQFSLNDALWNLLACAPGYPGVQTFTLKAVDKNGKTKTGQLIITINE